MSRINHISVCFFMMILIFNQAQSAEADNQSQNPPVTVDQVDLQRYAGTWYEIAKIPNRFQRHCIRNTTASYELRTDGKISVVNRCEKEDGNIDEATGVAKVVEGGGNAKLKVSFVSIFGFNLFWGDYWIIGLDEDYQFAVIGSPERKYGWILGRRPVLSDEQMQTIFSLLRDRGYDPDDFEMTPQAR